MGYFRKNKNQLAIVIISLFVTVFVAMPVFRGGFDSAFYNIDPAMALIGSALSLIKNGVIQFADHPGTPTITFISSAYLPIRIYTKLVGHINFIAWSFDNLGFLFLYTRYIFIGVFACSLMIFLLAVNRFSRTFFTIVFSCLACLSFSFIPRLGGGVLTESLTFLFVSLWLYIYSGQFKKPTKGTITALSFLAGFTVANKYNSFPILLVSVLLVLFLATNLKKRVVNFFVTSCWGLAGFFLGTWPIRHFYSIIAKHLVKVFFQSGSAHGNGRPAFLSADLYRLAVNNFFAAEKLPAIIFGATLILSIFLLIYGRRLKVSLERAFLILIGITLVSCLFIAKYQVSYYQFPNFLLLVYSLSYLINKVPKLLVVAACILTFPFTYKNIIGYQKSVGKTISDAVAVETTVATNKNNIPDLWDYGPTEDFMKIWLRGWSGGVFDKQLREKRPDILELKSDYKTVFFNYDDYGNIFDVCWDRLYIRKERALVFVNLYADRNLKISPIADSGIWVIQSNHCSGQALNSL